MSSPSDSLSYSPTAQIPSPCDPLDMRSLRESLRSPSPPPSYPTTGSNILMGRSSYQLFLSTHSRVIRIFNLPKDPASYLALLFYPATPHAPVSLWSLRQEYGGRPPGEQDSVWAVFKTHEQAVAALVLSGGSVSVATALESDLEPFSKLSKVELRRHSVSNIGLSQLKQRQSYPTFMQPPRVSDFSRVSYPVRQSHSMSDLRAGGMESSEDYCFTLSSNPPNPRNSFRQGDWICGSVKCSAHNFMRNTICIGCGSARSASSSISNMLSWPRGVTSPRFNGVSPSEFINVGAYPMEQPTPCYTEQDSPNVSWPSAIPPTMPRNGLSHAPPYTSRAPTFFPSPYTATPPLPPTYMFPSYPSKPASTNIDAAAVALKMPSILTPSGRAFSIGGKVQNISSDPLSPCVMYWPDNEPFPEPGQIRPLANMGTQPPPILNTGNRGPIEQQPGDWTCRKCDYLNWRRRKVCQTCFPYAEGNIDGVSASVQAERIAMLAQVLSAAQSHSLQPSPQFLTKPALPQSAIQQPLLRTGNRSCSLPTTLSHAADQPLLRTGNRSCSLPTTLNDAADYLYCSQASPPDAPHLIPANGHSLLPSFLDDDDYAASPTTSPSSIGSSSPQSTRGATLRKEPSSSSLSFGNGSSIWAMKSEEVEPLSAYY